MKHLSALKIKHCEEKRKHKRKAPWLMLTGILKYVFALLPIAWLNKAINITLLVILLIAMATYPTRSNTKEGLILVPSLRRHIVHHGGKSTGTRP